MVCWSAHVGSRVERDAPGEERAVIVSPRRFRRCSATSAGQRHCQAEFRAEHARHAWSTLPLRASIALMIDGRWGLLIAAAVDSPRPLAAGRCPPVGDPDPGHQRMAELAPTPAVVPAGSMVTLRQKSEPIWDSCDAQHVQVGSADDSAFNAQPVHLCDSLITPTRSCVLLFAWPSGHLRSRRAP